MIDVSIIVPVYNAEKYLEKAVRSMREQTVKNIEIILVDDGSKDGSTALCQKLAEEDGRIIVIRKENGGPGSARNTGIEAAQGEYIFFSDADDRMDPKLVETALSAARNEKADVVVFGFTDAMEEADGSMKVFAENLPKMEGSFDYDSFWENYEKLETSMSVWVRLFRREYIIDKGLRFNDMRNGEDGCFILDSYLKGFDRIVYLRKALYTYLRRPASATMRYNPKRGEAEYRLACRYKETLEAIPQAKGRFLYQIHRFSLNKLTIFITSVVSDTEMDHAEKTKLLKEYTRQENVREALADNKAVASFSKVQTVKFKLLKLGAYGLVIRLAKPWRYQ